MPIVTHCPNCRGTFNLPDSLEGKNAKCSRCQQVFQVPARPAPVEADVPTAELMDEPAEVPTAELLDAPPPARPRPAPAWRDPELRRKPPKSSGVGWIIALAVGIPLLLIFLVVGGIVVFALIGVFMYAKAPAPTGGVGPVVTVQPNPVPDNPAAGPNFPNNPPPGPAFPPAPDVPPAQPVVRPPPPRDPPPALKPPAPVEVTPAALAQDKVVKPLPSAVGDVVVGGGGRYLILSLPKQSKLAVFDASAAQVVKYLAFPAPVVAFAAGMDKLIVAKPDNTLESYSLKTFEKEQSAPAPVNGTVSALCMGSASNGPLWVQAKGDGPLGGGAAALVDPSTLKEWPADWGDKTQPAGGAFLRASEDGQTFAMRDGVGGEPHTVTAVAVQNGRPAITSKWNVSSSIVQPDADGRLFYTGCAVFGPTLEPVFPNPVPQQFCKPFVAAVGGPYFMRFDYKQWDQLGGDLSFFVEGAQEPFTALKNVEEVSNEQIAYGGNRDSLTHDQRIHFLAAAKLLVAIPKTNDQLILYRFDPEAELAKSSVDYLVVTSRPPTAPAKKGQEYAYSLAVKSKKGGVKYKLGSGPKGMAVDDAGKLTWTPPADADAANDVIVSVTDAGGQETLHSFRVYVGD